MKKNAKQETIKKNTSNTDYERQIQIEPEALIPNDAEPKITNDPETQTLSLIFKKLGVLLNDADMVSTWSWNADSIQVPIGRVTRAHRAKKFHSALNGLIQGIWAQTSTWRPIDGDEQNIHPLINLIQVQGNH